MSFSPYDKNVAKSLHDQLNCTGITENAFIPKEKENYRPKTLVDQTLEYIDPTPNIYTLFVQFNAKFFWNVLLPVEVKWSPRMTSCAGVCSFHPRNKQCVISLSTPLLKLRPRKDLIETLLHEMIHAYLFLTNNNRDRDGHGPIFQSHMKRINREAGTNITIYHDFHDEVKLYQQHWWRCNGPCQKRPPYFGMVRRAMNRAPGPNDTWWSEHQLTCGGQFTKIREPEKPQKKNSSKGKNSTETASKSSNNSSILDWVKKNDTTQNTEGKHFLKPPNQIQVISKNKNNSVPNVPTDLKKLGNSTNNVYGWGVSGPSNSSNNSTSNSKNLLNDSLKNDDSRFSFAKTLGGSGKGRSILLDKFPETSKNNSLKNTSLIGSGLNKTNSSKNLFKDLKKDKTSSETSFNMKSSPNNSFKDSSIDSYSENVVIKVNCPICTQLFDESKINDHLDKCLQNPNNADVSPSTSNNKRKNENNHSTPIKMFKNDNLEPFDEVECPLCNTKVKPINFNDHLDNCMQNDLDKNSSNHDDDDVIVLDNSGSSSVNLHDSPHVCLICNKELAPNETLNNHLEECVASVFNDSGSNDINKEEIKKEVVEKFPCPICMQLIHESLMNEHLDTCLVKEN